MKRVLYLGLFYHLLFFHMSCLLIIISPLSCATCDIDIGVHTVHSNTVTTLRLSYVVAGVSVTILCVHACCAGFSVSYFYCHVPCPADLVSNQSCHGHIMR